jgi:hypothetical protein
VSHSATKDGTYDLEVKKNAEEGKMRPRQETQESWGCVPVVQRQVLVGPQCHFKLIQDTQEQRSRQWYLAKAWNSATPDGATPRSGEHGKKC